MTSSSRFVIAPSLRDRAYAGLRELLMAGQLAPSDKVSARLLAANLGVSPMPVREAIHRLVAEGALVVRPQSGVRVPLMTRDRFVELTRVRIALEGMAAEAAAANVTSRELASIRRHHLRFRGAARRARPDLAKAIRANHELHFAVYACARMPELFTIIGGLWLRIGPVLNYDLRTSPRRLRETAAHDHHATWVAALERGDGPAARHALVGDIESAADYILSLDRLSTQEGADGP